MLYRAEPRPEGCCLLLERTGWDSNPRELLDPTRFPIVLLKPLGHRSPLERRGWDSNPRTPCERHGLANRSLGPLGHPSETERAPGGLHRPPRVDCPSRARTWTFLIQSQACCQLHQGAPNTRSPLQGLFLHGRGVTTTTVFREAGDGARTRDPQLGKLMLCQLSYSRKFLPNALQQSH